MINKSVAPSPQTYNIPQTKTKVSFSFGVSRDKFERVRIQIWLITLIIGIYKGEST
jgi:hypothetical protein